MPCPLNVLDDKNFGVFAHPNRNSFKDKFHTIIKGDEYAHVVQACHVAECEVSFMDKILDKSEVYFLENNEDTTNTFS